MDRHSVFTILSVHQRIALDLDSMGHFLDRQVDLLEQDFGYFQYAKVRN